MTEPPASHTTAHGSTESGSTGSAPVPGRRSTCCTATLCVPKTSSTSCDQAVFIDRATGAGLPSDAVPAEIDRLG
jgi:hypothetical protein